MPNFSSAGQASLEYMIILALSLLVFSTILYVTNSLISTSSIQVGVDAAYRAVDKIRDAADFIYVHGHPSRTEINVYIPPNIESLEIVGSNNSVRARVSVGQAYTDIYGVTKGELYGNLSSVMREGYYIFRVESTSENSINITRL
ncbi:MAG: hypothetical protein KKD39_07110 [Candidatus Altiarchaeota archaeon]|nr:hypothetical protein [Candidatus Altiarchaeota archaeon]